MPFKLTYLGNPVLRRICKPVENITHSPELKLLIDNLQQIVRDEDGAGLAAPQIGHNKRVFVMFEKEPELLSFFGPKYRTIINPRITSVSSEIVYDMEGCLSIPDYNGVVPRHESIDVEYYDCKNNLVKQCYDGFLARVFQHELDHLNGVLYTDRILPQTLMTSDELEKLDQQDIDDLIQNTKERVGGTNKYHLSR